MVDQRLELTRCIDCTAVVRCRSRQQRAGGHLFHWRDQRAWPQFTIALVARIAQHDLGSGGKELLDQARCVVELALGRGVREAVAALERYREKRIRL